jgi:DNA polymerase-3 subunit delta'
MAEEFKDPRDVAWHPRRADSLLGHEDAEARLLLAHQSGKLHHAWLISGPRGIGKATLAYRFAKFLLQVPDGIKARTHASLQVAAESPAARQVMAASHPDLLVIERAIDMRGKKLKTEIAVVDARQAQNFFARTAGAGGWRIAIVDCADELNGESANALLKVIEEPPRQSIFLLVCHQPGRLLRTIRSRCLDLHLNPLDFDNTLRVLKGLPPGAIASEEATLRQAAELSRGSPGRAMDLLGSKGAAAFTDFLKLPKLTPATAVEIGAAFTGRESPEDYFMFCELLTVWIAAQARAAGLRGKGEALAQAHDDIHSSLRQTDALNLDRRQTVTDALMRLEEALKAS